MDADLEAELAAIFAARDRDNMEPTIRALLPIHEQHPDDPHVLYELAGAHDTAGQEETALRYYEKAMLHGLSGDTLRRCLLQYGSTLRNVGRSEDSLQVFSDARKQFPESASLILFEALSLHASGRPSAALGNVLAVVADHVHLAEVDRYRAAIRGNAAHLHSLDDTVDAD
ncbi:MAG: tetratricopeptide repeat protein [Arachnia sp.]